MPVGEYFSLLPPCRCLSASIRSRDDGDLQVVGPGGLARRASGILDMQLPGTDTGGFKDKSVLAAGSGTWRCPRWRARLIPARLELEQRGVACVEPAGGAGAR